MDGKKSIWLRNAGYTITEAVTVVGAMGLVATFAAPNMIRMKATMEVQDAAAQVGGALQRTRARAASEGIPFLFLVQQEDVAEGERGEFAQIVRDNDRSYSVTAPDDVETFALEPDLSSDVRQYGVGSEAGVMDVPRAHGNATGRSPKGELPAETAPVSSIASELVGGVVEIVSDLLGGTTSTQARSTPAGRAGASSERLSDVVVNGSTFPVSEAAGVPGVAFNERGIPVALDSPSDWGTGAGAIYLTDNESAVFACVLSPLGEVSITRYDAGSGSWR